MLVIRQTNAQGKKEYFNRYCFLGEQVRGNTMDKQTEGLIAVVIKCTYQPSSYPRKFCNIKPMREYWLCIHLKIWWLSKAYTQTPKKGPLANELHPNQYLQDRKCINLPPNVSIRRVGKTFPTGYHQQGQYSLSHLS